MHPSLQNLCAVLFKPNGEVSQLDVVQRVNCHGEGRLVLAIFIATYAEFFRFHTHGKVCDLLGVQSV